MCSAHEWLTEFWWGGSLESTAGPTLVDPWAFGAPWAEGARGRHGSDESYGPPTSTCIQSIIHGPCARKWDLYCSLSFGCTVTSAAFGNSNWQWFSLWWLRYRSKLPAPSSTSPSSGRVWAGWMRPVICHSSIGPAWQSTRPASASVVVFGATRSPIQVLSHNKNYGNRLLGRFTLSRTTAPCLVQQESTIGPTVVDPWAWGPQWTPTDPPVPWIQSSIPGPLHKSEHMRPVAKRLLLANVYCNGPTTTFFPEHWNVILIRSFARNETRMSNKLLPLTPLDATAAMGAAWVHEGNDPRQPVAKFCRDHQLSTIRHDNWAG